MEDNGETTSEQFIPNEHNSAQTIQVPDLILMTKFHLKMRQDSELTGTVSVNVTTKQHR